MVRRKFEAEEREEYTMDEQNNDKMGYLKEARELGVKRDYKLKFAAMGAWWLVGTFIVFRVLFFAPLSFIMKLLISVPAGFAVMLLCYYVILPNISSERRFATEINSQFKSEGMSHHLAAKLDSHLMTKQFSSVEAGFYNGYLMMLAMYDLNMFNLAECLRKLDCMDMKHMQQFYRYPSGKQNMVTYYYLRMLAVSQMDDPQLIEYSYGDASKVFSECRSMNKLVEGMAVEAEALREVGHANIAKNMGNIDEVMARTDKAMQILLPLREVEAIKQDYCTIVGRCRALRGETAEANRLFDEASRIAKTDFQRECIRREREIYGVPVVR